MKKYLFCSTVLALSINCSAVEAPAKVSPIAPPVQIGASETKTSPTVHPTQASTAVAPKAVAERQDAAVSPAPSKEEWKPFDVAQTIFNVMMVLLTGALWISTRKLWIEGRKSMEVTERAFVFLDGFNIELATLADSPNSPVPESLPGGNRNFFVTYFAVRPRWKNSGNTPTRNMRIRIDWRGPLGPMPPDYAYRLPEEPFFVAPKASEPSPFIEMPGSNELIKHGLNPIGDRPMMFIWGRADYQDVFGKQHFIEWCYQVRFEAHKGGPLSASFIQWGNYNRSEEHHS